MADMIELLRARRSVRTYTDQPIEPAKLDLLKEAALRSPSSRNIDPWEFVFVEDRELLRKLARCKPYGARFLEHAALGIVVCGDSTQSDTWIEDCSIASILVQMVAQSLGLGSCWIQVRNRKFSDAMRSVQYVQELLAIPAHVQVQSIIAVGYPPEQREPLSQEDLRYAKLHVNRYGQT